MFLFKGFIQASEIQPNLNNDQNNKRQPNTTDENKTARKRKKTSISHARRKFLRIMACVKAEYCFSRTIQRNSIRQERSSILAIKFTTKHM